MLGLARLEDSREAAVCGRRKLRRPSAGLLCAVVFALAVLCAPHPLKAAAVPHARPLISGPGAAGAAREKAEPAGLPAKEGEEELKLVDVKVVEPEGEDPQFPKLDVIVRNPGKVAVLKRAIFHVERAWVLQSTWLYHAMPVSMNYTVKLSIYDAPYSRTFDIAQEVPGNGTDRFTFTMGNDGGEPMNRYVFLLRLDLIYNEDNKVLSTPRILFLAPPPVVAVGMTGGHADIRIKDTIHNWRVVREIGEFDGVISPTMKIVVKNLSLDIAAELLKNLVAAKSDGERVYYIKFLGRLGYPARVALADLQRIADENQSQPVRAAALDAIRLIKAAGEKMEPLVIQKPPALTKPPFLDDLPQGPDKQKPGKGSAPKIRVEQQRISSP